MNYPDHKTERAILSNKLPDLNAQVAEQIINFVQALRKEELEKKPGVAEMLDFAAAISGLGINDLSKDPQILQATLVTLLKTQADQAAIPEQVTQRLIAVSA